MTLAFAPERIETWPLARLQPYVKNAKLHGPDQVAKLAASMAEFGWTVPCLVGEDGELIAGHGRVLAATQLGLTKAPVIVLGHLSEAQRRAYRIADNRLAESPWDEALLSAELQDLLAGDFDLSLVGFSDGELDKLLAYVAEDDGDEGGAGGVWYPTQGGMYVQGGVFSANSDDTGFTLDDVFETGELFYILELGWSGLARTGVPVNARGPMDTNNAHLSFWYKDAQPDAASIFQPSAKGVAFNANFMSGPNFMWFARGGYSEGWVNRRNLTGGFGYRPNERFSDLLGFGAGWVEPSNAALREQYTTEAFYRFQVTSNFAVTPDIQYIRNPALNPTEDDLWVFGLRARVTF